MNATVATSETNTATPGSATSAAPVAVKAPRKARAAKLSASAGGPGDTLPAVAPVAKSPEEMAQENARLQKLLRASQEALAQAKAGEVPPEPIADSDLKPLLAEHIRTGASIGRHALTDAQKIAWKETKKARKLAINGRLYRKRVLGNVTRAANEGAFSRYKENVSKQGKRLTGFSLGARFAAPKAKKA